MTEDIVYEATYPHAPAEVWRALTGSMGAWFMDTDFRAAEVGHRFQLRDKPKKVLGWDGVTDCEVLEAVPERRLVFSFGAAQGGFPVTRIEWDLEPVAGGTRLRFRHTGFTGVKGWLMRQGMNRGWAAIVRHAIRYVVAETSARGAAPTQAETRAHAKAATRAEHGAQAKA